MYELRWYVRPSWDGPVKVLQFRVQHDVAVRAAVAGMWDRESIERTAVYQWSEWKDVPEVDGMK